MTDNKENHLIARQIEIQAPEKITLEESNGLSGIFTNDIFAEDKEFILKSADFEATSCLGFAKRSELQTTGKVTLVDTAGGFSLNQDILDFFGTGDLAVINQGSGQITLGENVQTSRNLTLNSLVGSIDLTGGIKSNGQPRNYSLDHKSGSLTLDASNNGTYYDITANLKGSGNVSASGKAISLTQMGGNLNISGINSHDNAVTLTNNYGNITTVDSGSIDHGNGNLALAASGGTDVDLKGSGNVDATGTGITIDQLSGDLNISNMNSRNAAVSLTNNSGNIATVAGGTINHGDDGTLSLAASGSIDVDLVGSGNVDATGTGITIDQLSGDLNISNINSNNSAVTLRNYSGNITTVGSGIINHGSGNLTLKAAYDITASILGSGNVFALGRDINLLADDQTITALGRDINIDGDDMNISAFGRDINVNGDRLNILASGRDIDISGRYVNASAFGRNIDISGRNVNAFAFGKKIDISGKDVNILGLYSTGRGNAIRLTAGDTLTFSGNLYAVNNANAILTAGNFNPGSNTLFTRGKVTLNDTRGGLVVNDRLVNSLGQGDLDINNLDLENPTGITIFGDVRTGGRNVTFNTRTPGPEIITFFNYDPNGGKGSRIISEGGHTTVNTDLYDYTHGRIEANGKNETLGGPFTTINAKKIIPELLDRLAILMGSRRDNGPDSNFLTLSTPTSGGFAEQFNAGRTRLSVLPPSGTTLFGETQSGFNSGSIAGLQSLEPGFGPTLIPVGAASSFGNDDEEDKELGNVITSPIVGRSHNRYYQ